MHHQLIPLLRILSDGKFHAGSELAQQLDISRATVCNALKSASDVGIRLYKVQGRGYQMPVIPDWLDATQIRAGLRGEASGFTIEIVDSIESTNTALLRAPEPATHRHCLLAEYQHAGRGRRGRSWLASLGGSVTCSVRWRFQQGIGALAGLSLAVGVALLRCLDALGARDLKLKWPNDLLWQDRKLAGILIEVQGEANGPSVAIIGIGINLRLPDSLRNTIEQPVTDLTEAIGHPVARNALLSDLLNALDTVMREFEASGLSQLRHEWSAAHAHAGQTLQVTLANGHLITGAACGLTPWGALLLQDDNGAEIAVHSGDVQLARKAS